jgi:diacylglycerol kinase family enzyme
MGQSAHLADAETYPDRVSGFLIVNPRAGGDRPSVDELRRAAQRSGVRVHVLGQGEDARDVARDADVDVLGIAGGDGSLAAVAQVAVERDLPFVCVPYGTRNHFARDLGLDRADPLRALAGFGGDERRVDVGRVDGRVFLNNVSIGLYAGLLHRREHHRRRREVLAGVRAVGLLAGEPHRFRARVDGRPLAARILLVANGSYELDLFTLGERTSLEEGRLLLYAADGWLPRSWSEVSAERFRIELERAQVEAAVDGEPTRLESPVEVEVAPRALRVLLPEQPDDVG